MTFIDYAEFIWKQDCTQQETADILGWSVTKVKNYSALSKVTELAWSAIVTSISSVTEEVTNVTFTEGILRPIIPLSESQQLDLVEGLISQKYSKQAFKKRAEVYQQQNRDIEYATEQQSRRDAANAKRSEKQKGVPKEEIKERRLQPCKTRSPDKANHAHENLAKASSTSARAAATVLAKC